MELDDEEMILKNKREVAVVGLLVSILGFGIGSGWLHYLWLLPIFRYTVQLIQSETQLRLHKFFIQNQNMM